MEGGEEGEVGGTGKFMPDPGRHLCLYFFSIWNCGCNVASPSDFQKKPEDFSDI